MQIWSSCGTLLLLWFELHIFASVVNWDACLFLPGRKSEQVEPTPCNLDFTFIFPRLQRLNLKKLSSQDVTLVAHSPLPTYVPRVMYSFVYILMYSLNTDTCSVQNVFTFSSFRAERRDQPGACADRDSPQGLLYSTVSAGLPQRRPVPVGGGGVCGGRVQEHVEDGTQVYAHHQSARGGQTYAHFHARDGGQRQRVSVWSGKVSRLHKRVYLQDFDAWGQPHRAAQPEVDVVEVSEVGWIVFVSLRNERTPLLRRYDTLSINILVVSSL